MNNYFNDNDIEKLITKIKDYAKSRESDIKRGAEAPRLAALLLQKYGEGIIEAVSVILDTPRAADAIQNVLDEETLKIDPEWQEHGKERWKGRPADIVIGKNDTNFKLLFLANKILGYLNRMKTNEKLDSVEVNELYLIYTSEYEKNTQDMIDSAILELIKRGLIERNDDSIILLYENIMVEE